MTITKELIQILQKGKYLDFLERLNSADPNNLDVIALLSDLNNLNSLFRNNEVAFADYQISKAKIRNRIFKLLQSANILFDIEQKDDTHLFESDIISLTKDFDVFIFAWHYNDRNSRFMINTFAICVGIVINECRHLGIESPKIIVDNTRLSLKSIKNIYNYANFKESEDIIKLSKITPKIVITVIDIIIMESALKQTYKFLKDSEIVFVKTIEEAIKIMQNE